MVTVGHNFPVCTAGMVGGCAGPVCVIAPEGGVQND